MGPCIEGITPQRLQSSPKCWWDETFSRLLLDAVPLDTKQIVELDCGMAAAAHSLLPSLPDARYLGTDSHAQRLAEAKTLMEQSRIHPRTELRLAHATRIPVEDDFADVVLSIMSLQHLPDVPAVLSETTRLLRTGGRFVAVEPDNLGQRFYFDGVLEEINRMFHELCLRARVSRQPSDIAIGPRLPSLLREARFQQIRMVAHVVHSSRMESAGDFFSRLARIAETIAQESGLEADDETMKACKDAINRTQFAGLPKRLGFSCHTVPVFLCVGRK